MKSLINYALFKEQLKRYWTITALSALWLILFVVSPFWSDVNRDKMYAVQSFFQIISMRNGFVIIAGVAAPLAAAISTYSYLFQPKSTTAMHALPLNKKQLFCTNTLAGLTLITIPLIILCALLLNPVTWTLPEMRIDNYGATSFMGYVPSIPAEIYPLGLADGAAINTFPVVAGFFLRALLTNAFYYALFLLAVSVAGNAIVSFLLCGAFAVLPCGILVLGHLIGSFFFFGYDEYLFDRLLMKVFTFTNPAALGSIFNFFSPAEPYAYVQSKVALHIIIYIIITIVLFMVAYWCYHVRKQERAGDSVVFVPLRSVLIFLLSTGGMIFLGAFLMGIFKSVTLLYVGFVIGFTIAYFIAQMIAEKTFNVLYKAKDIVKYGGVMTVLFIIVMIAARMDFLGYQTYQPNAEEVYGVYLQQPYRLNMNYGEERQEEDKQKYFVTEEKIIADALAVHNRITNERHTLRSTFLSSLESNSIDIQSQSFVYLLKNGKYVTRTYLLPIYFMQSSGLIELLSEETVILSPYITLKTPEEIAAVVLEYNRVYSENGNFDKVRNVEPARIVKLEEIRSVIEEIKKDLVVTERERLKNIASGENHLKELEAKGEKMNIYGYTELLKQGVRRVPDNFNLESIENVDKWLESHGMKKEIQEVNG